MSNAIERRLELLGERQEKALDLKWKKDLERVIQRRQELLKHVKSVGERAMPKAPKTAASSDAHDAMAPDAAPAGTNREAAP